MKNKKRNKVILMIIIATFIITYILNFEKFPPGAAVKQVRKYTFLKNIPWNAVVIEYEKSISFQSGIEWDVNIVLKLDKKDMELIYKKDIEITYLGFLKRRSDWWYSFKVKKNENINPLSQKYTMDSDSCLRFYISNINSHQISDKIRNCEIDAIIDFNNNLIILTVRDFYLDTRFNISGFG